MNTPNENWANTAEVIKVKPPSPLKLIAEEHTKVLLDYLKKAQGAATIRDVENIIILAMVKYKEST